MLSERLNVLFAATPSRYFLLTSAFTAAECKSQTYRQMKTNRRDDQIEPGESEMLTGFFEDREKAERAFNDLTRRGYKKDEINLVMSKETRQKHFVDRDEDTEMGNKAKEGTGAGSAIGGAAGAGVGVIAALGTSVAIPGLGIVVAGPIAGAIAGAGAGGITGGIAGALIGAGIPEKKAEKYKKGIEEGGIVIGVQPRNEEDAEYLENEWRTYEEENSRNP